MEIINHLIGGSNESGLPDDYKLMHGTFPGFGSGRIPLTLRVKPQDNRSIRIDTTGVVKEIVYEDSSASHSYYGRHAFYVDIANPFEYDWDSMKGITGFSAQNCSYQVVAWLELD